MSTYSSLAMVGMFDLISGTFVAYLVNAFFEFRIPNQMPTPAIWFKEAFLCLLQGWITLFISEEMKVFFFPANYEDSTGAILYILSVFRQPVFWERVDWCATTIIGMIERAISEGGNSIQDPTMP